MAIVCCKRPLLQREFTLINKNSQVLLSDTLSSDLGEYLAFPHHYRADFSKFRKQGYYRLRVGEVSSPPFAIDLRAYHDLPDSLLRFFEVQRCGSTAPLLHQPCHLKDVTQMVGSQGTTLGLDLTGGWHDAGDYIKFEITTAYSAYLLLLTAELFPDLWEDSYHEGKPNLLSEAKVGLDWLMKMHPSPNRLLTQVQDTSDHRVGWRMPENDPLTGQRTGFEAPSQAQAGLFVAAMAISVRLFEKAGDRAYSQRCLEHAKDAYALAFSAMLPRAACAPDSHYFDDVAMDNVALAAGEMFETIHEKVYLDTAKAMLQRLGGVGWVSWGDVGGFACYRVGKHWDEGNEMLTRALAAFDSVAGLNPFAYPASFYPWGSCNIATGVGDLAVLSLISTNDPGVRRLAQRERDFLLGTNPFGLSFVSQVGSDWPHNFHHQVSYLLSIPLPGAVAGGPIAASIFERSGIQLDSLDRFSAIQTAQAVYHDDRADFLCNEATLAGNAQALLLLAWFAAGE